jgi:hypothetical protein
MYNAEIRALLWAILDEVCEHVDQYQTATRAHVADESKYAQTIQSSGNDLLNGILDLSKIEAGHVDIRPEPVLVERLVSGLRQLFQPVAQEKNLDFAINVPKDCPELVLTDPQRLEQILKNLLSNAFKFTEGGRVSLSLRRVTADRISFAVTDTGIGISEEQQKRVCVHRMRAARRARWHLARSSFLSCIETWRPSLERPSDATSETESGGVAQRQLTFAALCRQACRNRIPGAMANVPGSQFETARELRLWGPFLFPLFDSARPVDGVLAEEAGIACGGDHSDPVGLP